MKSKSCKNLFDFDKEFDVSALIGTDEAGRGPGAGGVFASAVFFKNPSDEVIEKLAMLNDSKKLTKKVREELYDIIQLTTINSTVCVEVEEIENINILNASLKAMKIACENVITSIKNEKNISIQSFLQTSLQQPEKSLKISTVKNEDLLVLVDGNKLIKSFNFPQNFVIKGDSKSASIAAASILAKVSRDRYMQELDKKFPQYNWQQNAGYLTKEHLEAIEKFGITPYHRKSFLKGRNTKQLSLLS